MSTLTHLARFVLVDLTLLKNVAHETRFLVQPLLLETNAQDDDNVVEDLKHRHTWTLPSVRSKDTIELFTWLVEHVIGPAVQKIDGFA